MLQNQEHLTELPAGRRQVVDQIVGAVDTEAAEQDTAAVDT